MCLPSTHGRDFSRKNAGSSGPRCHRTTMQPMPPLSPSLSVTALSRFVAVSLQLFSGGLILRGIFPQSPRNQGVLLPSSRRPPARKPRVLRASEKRRAQRGNQGKRRSHHARPSSRNERPGPGWARKCGEQRSPGSSRSRRRGGRKETTEEHYLITASSEEAASRATSGGGSDQKPN